MRRAALWGFFFLASCGLGYATLDRFDPRASSDAKYYAAMAAGESVEQSRCGHRPLVPLLARPICAAARGRCGSWEPALLGLLVVNAAFVAAACLLLVKLGERQTRDPALSLLAALVYLVNFQVANCSLAGLIESVGDACVLGFVLCLLSGKWWPLPLLSALAAVAKETDVPLLAVFALGWALAESPRKLARAGWVALVLGAGAAAVGVVLLASGLSVNYMVGERHGGHSAGEIASGLVGCFTAHAVWYTFGWLLPLGLASVRSLPVEWRRATWLAVGFSLVVGAVTDMSDNVARPLFKVAGPLLSLAAAMTLVRLTRRDSSGESSSPPVT